ncbi:acetyl-CoA C-acyltransferase [Microbacterium sp. zg.Y625]|uniref:thiolase family protein n=1 Tax=Microbacterium jiangjiandongii TaxID=3049071 RepID=UPI00214C2C48|nr:MULTISPECIES: acetyl-CoA C-acyltransferase [unclassified Microbacterium]MCR2794056.1 acetyl-CoA C-acyltransferase [Microbacterium sp. zg.Y625]MCR2816702.1 acetyl-CoA C-acyltransferase [Microbacterium sp. zg.Y843]WIM25736.1 acetyl-CoA C-acyltransferase [Microbacterium sp. zg-Y625]
MATAVIVDVVRTPSGRGKPGGALSGVHPVDLAAGVLAALLERNGLESRQIDDVLLGCVSQVGEQSGNVARQAVLAAGFDETVPASTVDRQCGSSQQAAHFAAQGVIAGAYDIVIAGGVESMSRVPLGAAAAGGSPFSPRLHARYPEGLVNQGVSAELIAAKWSLSRDELDRFAAASHERAARAAVEGRFASQLLPIGDLAADETVRAGTTVEALAGLSPAFRTEAYAARFPDVEWKITPGNSSPLTDGASAALIMSEQKAAALGLTPRARFHSFAVVGDDPLMMLTGPIPATARILERSGLGIDDLDVYEVNEAFASVPLAWAAETGADPARLNPWGGAIALGHALGSSGTRLLGTMLAHLEATGGRYGLQTMCEGGGMANATIIERL